MKFLSYLPHKQTLFITQTKYFFPLFHGNSLITHLCHLVLFYQVALGISGCLFLKEINALNIKNTDNFPDPAKLTRDDRDK
jgi:hypothetical protein